MKASLARTYAHSMFNVCILKRNLPTWNIWQEFFNITVHEYVEKYYP